jgi:hypothetical protein
MQILNLESVCELYMNLFHFIYFKQVGKFPDLIDLLQI